MYKLYFNKQRFQKLLLVEIIYFITYTVGKNATHRFFVDIYIYLYIKSYILKFYIKSTLKKSNKFYVTHDINEITFYIVM